MLQKTIDKYEKILDEIIDRKISISQYCKETGQKVTTFYVQMNNIAKGAIDDIEVRERLLKKYEIAKGRAEGADSPASSEGVCESASTLSVEEIETDDVAETTVHRDDEGFIKYYCYNIFRRGKTPLFGKLTREEMNTIYRLYSFYGDSLPQRIVSRHFPDLSLIDLKRILRAFNITKASAPFAPHMFEEKSEAELREIQLREKENSFLRKAEEDQIKNTEKLLKKYAQENIELKNQLESLSNFEIKVSNTIEPIILPEYHPVGQSMTLYLSDLHLGATVTSGAMYQENTEYSFEEAQRRLTKVVETLNDFDCFDTFNLVLMGDNVDCSGFTGRTARLDHYMPENMDAREQGNKFIELMMWFIDALVNIDRQMVAKLRIFSVPCGNHGGTFEYMCNKALLAYVNAKYPTVETTLWEEFFGIFKQDNHTFVCCHGKDDQYMKKGLPLDLNDKTKVMLYEWLNDQGIYGDNIHFVKGDLHSNSLSSCKRIDYRNVLSLFGASDYSNYNFSRNSYGVSYDLFIGEHLIRGTFENM